MCSICKVIAQKQPKRSEEKPTQSQRLGFMASKSPPRRTQAKTAASLGRPHRRKLLLPQRARARCAEQVTSPLSDVMSTRLSWKREGGGGKERRPFRPGSFCALHSHVHGIFFLRQRSERASVSCLPGDTRRDRVSAHVEPRGSAHIAASCETRSK